MLSPPGRHVFSPPYAGEFIPKILLFINIYFPERATVTIGFISMGQHFAGFGRLDRPDKKMA
jgi:hypothetical protein